MASLKDRQEKRLQDFIKGKKTGKKGKAPQPTYQKTPEQKTKMEAGKAARKADFAKFLGMKICRESNSRKVARERIKDNAIKLLDKPNEYNNYDQYVRIYHNDTVCKEHFARSLYKLNGLPGCPRCKKETKVTKQKNRPGYYCNGCKRQFSITTGTVLFKMKLSYQKFYKLKYYESDDRNGVTYQKMATDLNVPIYTAFLALKKFRAAGMDQSIFFIPSGSDVVADTFSFAGLNSNRPDHLKQPTKKDAHALHKQGVVAVAKGGNARAMAIDNRDQDNVEKAIVPVIGEGSTFRSDEGGEFAGMPTIPCTDKDGNPITDKDGNTINKYPVCITYNHKAGDHGDGTAESYIAQIKNFLFNHGNNVSKANMQYSLNTRTFHHNTRHLTTCQREKLASANLVRRRDKPVYENKPARARRRSTFAKHARKVYAPLLEQAA